MNRKQSGSTAVQIFGDRGAAFPPSIELTRVYEKVSAKGTRYMVGRLGAARITLLPGDPVKDGTPVWRVLLQEAPNRQAADSPARSKRSLYSKPHPASGGPPLPNDGVGDLWRRGEP